MSEAVSFPSWKIGKTSWSDYEQTPLAHVRTAFSAMCAVADPPAKQSIWETTAAASGSMKGMKGGLGLGLSDRRGAQRRRCFVRRELEPAALVVAEMNKKGKERKKEKGELSPSSKTAQCPSNALGCQ